ANLAEDGRAGDLGLYKALLYNEQEGQFETFRPYALPSAEWINYAVSKINNLSKEIHQPNQGAKHSAA
ncbi:MAG: hypothetical protein ACO1QB_04965, partial [Verrucomicrobiales bacterium]